MTSAAIGAELDVLAEAAAGGERLRGLQRRVEPLYTQLAAHPLYRSMRTLEELHRFMEVHVFAVWDFMSLLKALQAGLTTVTVPWVPRAMPEASRLINEIVLGEESDLYEGEAVSHFALYLRAMRQCGASTAEIETMLGRLGEGVTITEVLERGELPAAAVPFVRTTFAFLETGKMHVIAAAFTFGREDLIPGVFQSFIRDQDERLQGKLALFRWYLDRHIEVDGEEHGPMALRMVAGLCGDDPVKWREAEMAAVEAIEARLALWDRIQALIEAR